jgi:hypothetical protein
MPSCIVALTALMLCLPHAALTMTSIPGSDSLVWKVEPLIEQAEQALYALAATHRTSSMPIERRMEELLLGQGADCDDLREYLQLQRKLGQLNDQYALQKSKLRFRKGIEVLKMLYEKILAMDHHFSSMKTQRELLNISNPHFYPEFAETRSVIDERIKRKFGFTLPEALQVNPFLSATFSIVGMVLSSSDDREKRAHPEKIACILDFTVRIYTDLNTLFYETGYLRDINSTLKADCESLFADCVRPIGYNLSLINCRQDDDWERLFAILDQRVSTALDAQHPEYNPALVKRLETNLLFALERITQFITRYANFVLQGSDYYQKFTRILEPYDSDLKCARQLPDTFRQLKSDIRLTLEKFNQAYKLPEIQGSRLKDMLFGPLE